LLSLASQEGRLFLADFDVYIFLFFNRFDPVYGVLVLLVELGIILPLERAGGNLTRRELKSLC
jgi:hypothetical protein